jgi:hypothetical protein
VVLRRLNCYDMRGDYRSGDDDDRYVRDAYGLLLMYRLQPSLRECAAWHMARVGRKVAVVDADDASLATATGNVHGRARRTRW